MDNRDMFLSDFFGVDFVFHYYDYFGCECIIESRRCDLKQVLVMAHYDVSFTYYDEDEDILHLYECLNMFEF